MKVPRDAGFLGKTRQIHEHDGVLLDPAVPKQELIAGYVLWTEKDKGPVDSPVAWRLVVVHMHFVFRTIRQLVVVKKIVHVLAFRRGVLEWLFGTKAVLADDLTNRCRLRQAFLKIGHLQSEVLAFIVCDGVHYSMVLDHLDNCGIRI